MVLKKCSNYSFCAFQIIMAASAIRRRAYKIHPFEKGLHSSSFLISAPQTDGRLQFTTEQNFDLSHLKCYINKLFLQIFENSGLY